METVDNFTTGPIDPRIYKELATDMWRETVSYLPVKDILKLPNLCKYFNEEVVWHPHSGRLMWGEMPHIDEKVFKRWRGDTDPPSHTALMRACCEGAKIVHITCLLAGGTNVNAVDVNGRTALYTACWRGREGIVRVLLGANADPNIAAHDIAAHDGWTPLLIASLNGHSSVMSLLIGAGTATYINHADNDGRTALMMACLYRHGNCVRVLVNARANLDMRDNFGRTALDIARHDYYSLSHDIIRILEEALSSQL